jgi:ferritin-like metal-binding protein YciE
MKKDAKFEDLFQENLKDLYDAEKQLVAALPKMIAAASSEELSSALETHLDQTKDQVSRLEDIFERMGEAPEGRECRTMQALIAEGERLIGELGKSQLLDVALIAAGQKVEHYEIAGYTTVCSLAEILGQQESFELLHETLNEESEANETLAEVSEALLSGEAREA